MTFLRRPARTAATLLTAGLLMVTAAPALAHVHVHSEDEVKPGAKDVRMTFHVPNERDDARTVGVWIEAPKGVRGMRAEQAKGWTARQQAPDGGSGTVGWSGGAISGEDGADFVVHIGHVPTGVDALTFVAKQRYDDGKVVSWDQPAEEGKPEPEHPAPVLGLTGASHAESAPHAGQNPGLARTAAVVCGAVVLLAAAALPALRSTARRRKAVSR
ncbi:DUF1775 domain-containing protein [Streptomyces sp. M2CJ-2]|uniref:DUF1775 domain-containing protein n=1 Tax=Streptomyces sp. M2CJ-2 TaxID=2803948 RepID=UPI00192751E9|nr:DUF1775 domain-containing protein [Streptomyces sp. M2CJ-2]MBL3667225.1 DUF1775 domain-containing protein [Streptomyces sp. M2CJ-2]